jgi:hypothetical protein
MTGVFDIRRLIPDTRQSQLADPPSPTRYTAFSPWTRSHALIVEKYPEVQCPYVNYIGRGVSTWEAENSSTRGQNFLSHGLKWGKFLPFSLNSHMVCSLQPFVRFKEPGSVRPSRKRNLSSAGGNNENRSALTAPHDRSNGFPPLCSVV